MEKPMVYNMLPVPERTALPAQLTRTPVIAAMEHLKVAGPGQRRVQTGPAVRYFQTLAVTSVHLLGRPQGQH
jgi:hypothetical protein